jgi:hypothetical protein
MKEFNNNNNNNNEIKEDKDMRTNKEITNKIEEIIIDLPDYVKQSIYYDYDDCKYQFEYDTTDAQDIYYKSLNDYGLNGWVDADDVIQYAISNGFNPDDKYINSDDNYKKELALELIKDMDFDGINTINSIKEIIELINEYEN